MNSDQSFVWQPDNKGRAFDELKHLLASDEVLAYYDVRKPVAVQCDRFQTGLAAVLLQDNWPIEYASHALSLTEQSFAQIERDLLAMFGLERLHSYIYGRHFSVETDQKSLLAIIKKSLISVLKRRSECCYDFRSTIMNCNTGQGPIYYCRYAKPCVSSINGENCIIHERLRIAQRCCERSRARLAYGGIRAYDTQYQVSCTARSHISTAATINYERLA